MHASLTQETFSRDRFRRIMPDAAFFVGAGSEKSAIVHRNH